MSAAVHDLPATRRRPDELSEDLQDAQKARSANAGWEMDRTAQSARSERRAWIVAGSACALTAVAVAAVFVQGPLRRIETIPVVVDRMTGETSIGTTLDVQTIPVHDALDMHNAAKFVRCRESYAWMFLQNDYDCVMRMSTPGVFGEYNQQFDGPEALDKRLGPQGEYRINIVNIRLPPTKRTGNLGEAVVTYDKETRLPNNPTAETQRYVATLRFEYRPKLLERPRDRTENPFGFVTTAYRSDAELIKSTPPKSY